MLKIFPVIIFPFIFFFIFSNVGNLTLEKKHIDSNSEITNSPILIDEPDVLEEEKNSNMKGEIVKKEPEKSSQIEQTKVNQTILKNVNKEPKSIVQFGAFSKEENAVILAEKIEKKLLVKFPNIQISVENNKKNNLFKILFYSENFDKAKNICNYSKKIGFSCLLVKK